MFLLNLLFFNIGHVVNSVPNPSRKHLEAAQVKAYIWKLLNGFVHTFLSDFYHIFGNIYLGR
jgi:hypothetical protein